MTLEELERLKKSYFDKYLPYKLTRWNRFNYERLSNIIYRKRSGRGSNDTYNDVIIMADTETSKSNDRIDNYIVAWTISLRAFNRNIVTLYGSKPRDMIQCIYKMLQYMKGIQTIIYFHNLSYDWIFIRKFLFERFGYPIKQLNTRSLNPIYIEFMNGLIIKDSLILAQRSLDKWAKDMNVEHLKASGKWDYNKIRHQKNYRFSKDELEYIEHDTLAGVECIDAMKHALNKHLFSMPYTATGIPREEVRKRGKQNNARQKFKKMCPTFEQYLKLECVYHGGYVHGNRHYIDTTIDILFYKFSENLIKGYDFASSYPFVMLSEMYPMEKFTPIGDKDPDYILRNADKYAFMFKLVLVRPRLKDDSYPMPALQFSKCENSINAILDNGRILCAAYTEIWITELDLEVIMSQYEYDQCICCQVEVARKDYLPRWFTDYVYELFKSKCDLKYSTDKVAYAIAKAKLNSLYGLCVQKWIKPNINEDYVTGDFIEEQANLEELFNKSIGKHGTILPYQWGVWVTAYAFKNLFRLGSCCENWLYSDTDSCYGFGWDDVKVQAYNDLCKDKLKSNGYDAVVSKGHTFWLGIAEHDHESDCYTEFRYMGAKRYCGRNAADNELHITVAGVPKVGVSCLNDDINNFTKGFVFPGEKTGKLTHKHIYKDAIFTNQYGDEIGDSIDLSPCDYLLNSVNVVDWQKIFEEEIEVQCYE